MNPNILSITPSATLAISARARELAAEGRDICNFSAGEPDFDTPDLIKEAAVQALRAGATKYTPAAGLKSLREAVSEKLRRDNHIDVPPEQVVISNGAKHSLALVFQTLCEPGDEILIPAPYWVSYPEMIRVAGGRPVMVPGEEDNHFKITPERLRAAATPRTRCLLLNSPSNPIGTVYSRDELAAIGELACERDWTLVSDEIYEHLVYDGARHVSMAGLSGELLQRTITVNGFSKAYAMTGWRLGYTAGPAGFIKAMISLQSHCASAPNTFAQHGALAALKHGDSCIEEMRAAFETRRGLLYEKLSAIEGIHCVRPLGAFYMLPNIGAFGLDSLTFSRRLLEEAGTAVVPGAAFGSDRHVRLSYACGEDEITDGVSRLAGFCKSLTS